jgi:hypothetical protein
VRAPFAGVVIAKAAQPGEIVSPLSAGGGFTRTGIGTIVDMDSLEVEVEVGEAFIGRVQPKMPVEPRSTPIPTGRSRRRHRDHPRRRSRQGDGEGARGAEAEGRAHRARHGRARELPREARRRRREAQARRARAVAAIVQRDGKDVAFVVADAEGRARATSNSAARSATIAKSPKALNGGDTVVLDPPEGARRRHRPSAREGRVGTVIPPPTSPRRPRLMSTLVSIRNLHKTYRRGPETVDVLHGIDLDITKGDFVALMGPSGSARPRCLNLIRRLWTRPPAARSPSTACASTSSAPASSRSGAATTSASCSSSTT